MLKNIQIITFWKAAILDFIMKNYSHAVETIFIGFVTL